METAISPLQFALTTVPAPPMASPTSGNPNVIDLLTVVASNINSSSVTVVAIRIIIPFGTGASQLTNNASIIVNTPANWTVDSEQSSTSIDYTFTPNTGFADFPSQQSVSFIFQNITVNQIPGTVEKFRAYGCINDDVPPNCHYVDFPLTKFPDGWGQVNFTATPVNINVGDPVVLSWNGPSGATYSIQYYDATSGQIINIPAQGAAPLSSNGVYPGKNDPPIALTETCVFTLFVTETIGIDSYSCQVQQTVTVDVPQTLKIVSFESSTATISEGSASTILWETEIADNCFLSIKEESGAVAIGSANNIIRECTMISNDGINLTINGSNGNLLGTLVFPSPQPTFINLLLAASNGGGVVQEEMVITLGAPIIQVFNIQGQKRNGEVIWYLIVWQVTYASTVTITNDGESSNVSGSGSLWACCGSVVLTASGFGNSQTATININ